MQPGVRFKAAAHHHLILTSSLSTLANKPDGILGDFFSTISFLGNFVISSGNLGVIAAELDLPPTPEAGTTFADCRSAAAGKQRREPC